MCFCTWRPRVVWKPGVGDSPCPADRRLGDTQAARAGSGHHRALGRDWVPPDPAAPAVLHQVVVASVVPDDHGKGAWPQQPQVGGCLRSSSASSPGFRGQGLQASPQGRCHTALSPARPPAFLESDWGRPSRPVCLGSRCQPTCPWPSPVGVCGLSRKPLCPQVQGAAGGTRPRAGPR